MTYPFVQSRYDYGLRKGPVRAFVVHMAEGGNTVHYLATNPDRGVSVHFVIEYSGRIVQMLLESHASGSINPNDLRTTDGPAPYGATVRKAVMGDWDHDPNSAVISLEIEGFASAGPNSAQAKSLVRLVEDVRSRFPTMGLLGHRDFTSTKACPGAHIDWASLGGHGKAGPPRPAPAQYRAYFRPLAKVRVYTLRSRPGVDCIASHTDERWGLSRSSAPCEAPIRRSTCDGTSHALTTRVTGGTRFGGKTIWADAGGVTVRRVG